MRRRLSITTATAVIGAMLIGPAAASAVPDETQRLRGLEGRTFQVSVTVSENVPLGLPPTFDNCYTFDELEVYVDPLFPAFDPAASVPGTWEQHGIGASTTYSADAAAGPVVFEQDGKVTPAKGGGVLQLTAYAEISVGANVLASFESVGFENPNCVEDVFGSD